MPEGVDCFVLAAHATLQTNRQTYNPVLWDYPTIYPLIPVHLHQITGLTTVVLRNYVSKHLRLCFKGVQAVWHPLNLENLLTNHKNKQLLSSSSYLYGLPFHSKLSNVIVKWEIYYLKSYETLSSRLHRQTHTHNLLYKQCKNKLNECFKCVYTRYKFKFWSKVLFKITYRDREKERHTLFIIRPNAVRHW